VAALDIDPQGSLAQWGKVREAAGLANPAVEVVRGYRLQNHLDALVRKVDVVVVDTPPHADTEARIAVRAAKLVVIPVQPSPMDVWATRLTIDLARQEKVPVLLVANRVPPRAGLTEAMLSAAAELGQPIATTRLGNRTAFPTAMFEGRGVVETQPRGTAAAEIKALIGEIEEIVGA
jgi:chromosome partitioning protein